MRGSILSFLFFLPSRVVLPFGYTVPNKGEYVGHRSSLFSDSGFLRHKRSGSEEVSK